MASEHKCELASDPREWIAERRRLIDAATPGPWVAEFGAGENVVLPQDAQSTREAVFVAKLYHQVADANLAADARTSLPRALDALEQVLSAHQPIEVEPSDTICAGCSHRLPTGKWAKYMPVVEHPCATVKAITEALVGAS